MRGFAQSAVGRGNSARVCVAWPLMHGLVKGVRFGAVVIVVALALAGCSGNGRSGESSAGSSTQGASWSGPEAPPDPHTLLRAAGLAVSQGAGSVLIFIESQTSDEGTWKARVVTADGTEKQLTIGSDAVAVLVGPTVAEDGDADKAKRRANVDGARLDYRAAVHKVLSVAPNGSITELSLVDMNGTTVWHADVWDTDLVEHDVTVDAASGAITANPQV